MEHHVKSIQHSVSCKSYQTTGDTQIELQQSINAVTTMVAAMDLQNPRIAKKSWNFIALVILTARRVIKVHSVKFVRMKDLTLVILMDSV